MITKRGRVGPVLDTLCDIKRLDKNVFLLSAASAAEGGQD